MYSNDYDGTYFNSRGLPNNAGQGPDGTNTQKMMAGGLDYFVRPYTKTAGVLLDPSDDGANYWGRNSIGLPAGVPRQVTSYLWRHILDVGGPSQSMTPVKESQIGSSAGIMALMEISAFHNEKQPLYNNTPPLTTRTVDAAFCDGHVKTYRFRYLVPASWDTNFDPNWIQSLNNGDLANSTDYDVP